MFDCKIAIIGANSHIANTLVRKFIVDKSFVLFLFSRTPELIERNLANVLDSHRQCYLSKGYISFDKGNYDVIINCIGPGTPGIIGKNHNLWFSVTEQFDNMVLRYLQKHPDSLYINFSSGAIYGTHSTMPAQKETKFTLYPNAIAVADYYSIAKLNSEAKHRSFSSLNIVDLRIFSYFSRYIDLNSGFFLAEVLKSIVNNNVFQTHGGDIFRDYVHPCDLFSLIKLCIEKHKLNVGLDVYSREPTTKFRLLQFFEKQYDLSYKIIDAYNAKSTHGQRATYCSNNENTCNLTGYKPSYNAYEAVALETSAFFKNKGINCG